MSSGASDNSASEDELEIIQEPETVELVETPNEELNENQEGEGASTEDTDKKEVKVKRVRNPQPKLNADRLRGPRGLTVLEDIFKKVKFKGSNHEEEDLNLLMRTYEYWCHRLFPKFSFEDCLERLEKLGTTKPVQAYIKRIRMNLMFDDAPIIDTDDDDDVGNDTNDVAISHNRSTTERDEFDRLLPSPLPSQSNEAYSGELTEEQLTRIRLNREKAQQRRKEVVNHNSQFSQDMNVTSLHASGITISQNDEPINIFDNVVNLNFNECNSNPPTLTYVSSENLQNENDNLSQSSQNITDTNVIENNVFENDFFERSESDTIVNDVLNTPCSSSSITVNNFQERNQDCSTRSSSHCAVAIDRGTTSINQIDSDKISAVRNFASSQECKTLPNCMSFESEKRNELRSSAEIIISETPMDLD